MVHMYVRMKTESQMGALIYFETEKPYMYQSTYLYFQFPAWKTYILCEHNLGTLKV